MSNPVLVRGSESTVLVNVLRVVVGALTIGAVVLLAQPGLGAVAMLLAVVAVAVFVVNEVTARRNAAQRRWVTDTGSGFHVLDNAGERMFHDNHVTDVILEIQEHYSAGLLKSIGRKFVVWVEGAAEPIDMFNKFPAQKPDPLVELIKRILEGLKQRGQRRLQEGGRLDGEGWSLERGRLAIWEKSGPMVVPLEELAEIGVFSGKLCIWRKGEEHPLARIAPASRNAPVLQALLGECIQENEEKAGAAAGPASPPSVADASPTADGLGRVLFERRSNTLRVLLAVAAPVACVAGLVMAASHEIRPAGLMIALAGIVGAVAVWRVPPAVFQCHELGVRYSGATGRRQIRYTDVHSFSYQAVRHFVNGAYTGTHFTLKFQSPAAEIVYRTTLKNQDDDLDSLRDHVSRVIAAEMQGELAAGRPVRWTPNLAFLPEGIQHRPKGFLGRGSPQVLPYSQVRGFNMDKGVFYVFAQGAKRATISEDVSAANFFPGFFLFLTVFEKPDQPSDAS